MLYLDWFAQTKANLVYARLKQLSYVGLVIIIGDVVSGIMFDYDFNKYLVLTGFIFMFGAWLIPEIIKRIEKSKMK